MKTTPTIEALLIQLDPKEIARVAGELARRHRVLLAQPEMLPKTSVILDDIDRGWADARTQVIEAYREMYGVEPTSEFADNAATKLLAGG